MCVLIYYTTFVRNIFLSKKNWARYDQKYNIGLHVKYRLFLSHFNETWIFSTDFFFFLNPEMWNVIKIRPVGPDVFHPDRGTDVTKLIVAFRNSATAPKNISSVLFRRFVFDPHLVKIKENVERNIFSSVRVQYQSCYNTVY